MSIEKRLFGKTPQGEEVFEFVLANDNAEVSLISRGAALRRLLVADKDGEKEMCFWALMIWKAISRGPIIRSSRRSLRQQN